MNDEVAISILPFDQYRHITVGFSISAICFPFSEWSNWKWGRESKESMFCVGPMRFQATRITATRNP